VLFIDEIHTIVQGGSVRGSSVEISSVIKPALARGDLHCIGTATLEDYRRNIERDPVLERRFQVVRIQEPDQAVTLQILSNAKQKFEDYYQVKYDRKTLKLSAELAKNFLRDRALPDKAIDLLDRAGASVAFVTQHDPQLSRRVVPQDIISLVSRISRIPVNKIDQSNTTRYQNMAQIIRRKIIGQNQAIQQVSRVIRTNRLKFKL
ncbi:MAG: ATP-dependent Clp protease ATP-binding subunit, partial [Planctomycetes bacterium]|nr:ATP-dependent Clp protease ATP-binding subunit [Planctomycetota bacterium]